MQKAEVKVHPPPPVGCLHLSAVPQADPICSWGQQGGSHSRRDQEWGQAPNTAWEGRCLCQEAEAGGGQSILQTVNGKERREERGLWNHPEDKLVAAPGCSSLGGVPARPAPAGGKRAPRIAASPGAPPLLAPAAGSPAAGSGVRDASPEQSLRDCSGLLCVPLSPPSSPSPRGKPAWHVGSRGWMLTQGKSGEIWGATGPRRKQGVGDNVLLSPASPPSPPACLSEQGVALCGGHC